MSTAHGHELSLACLLAEEARRSEKNRKARKALAQAKEELRREIGNAMATRFMRLSTEIDRLAALFATLTKTLSDVFYTIPCEGEPFGKSALMRSVQGTNVICRELSKEADLLRNELWRWTEASLEEMTKLWEIRANTEPAMRVWRATDPTDTDISGAETRLRPPPFPK